MKKKLTKYIRVMGCYDGRHWVEVSLEEFAAPSVTRVCPVLFCDMIFEICFLDKKKVDKQKSREALRRPT